MTDKSQEDKPTICVMLYGSVIPHGVVLNDETLAETAPTPGFLPWLLSVQKSFQVLLYAEEFVHGAVRYRVANWLEEIQLELSQESSTSLEFDRVTLDARIPDDAIVVGPNTIRHEGDWFSPSLDLERLLAFGKTPEPPWHAERKSFNDALTELINKYSMENDSNTPDFILAEYIQNCMIAFSNATRARDKWNGSASEGANGCFAIRDPGEGVEL